MASQSPVALPYEVGTVFYPRLVCASQWALLLWTLLFLLTALGAYLLLWRPFVIDLLGSLYLGTSALVVVGLTLMYLPSATWLYLSETGMTFSLAFWRRSVQWSRVRELRLVIIGDGRISETVMRSF